MSAQATQEVFCAPPGTQVYLGTFSSAGLARAWMSANATGADACIEGSGWAAQVSFLSTAPYNYQYGQMTQALHGREVTIGNC